MKTPQLPFPALSKALGITNEVWLKREDKHNYGSHKGRSIPLLIKQYNKEGIRDFIVSSSGNAAWAGIKAVQAANQNNPNSSLSLQVFVGKKISEQKINTLKKEISDSHITLEQVDNPKQQAFQAEKDGKGKWLRQSTDDNALTGYLDLAKELAKIPNLAAVFVPTSSGTTAQGLFAGFKLAEVNPEIHIIQTPICHPIADQVITTPFLSSAPTSLATAIVDNVAHRKEKVAEAIKASGGAGWIATDEQILEAIKITRETCGFEISPNSALSVAGLMQAIKNGKKWDGSVVCLITGP